MPLFSFEGKHPSIHPSAFIAETATIVGDVTIEEGASVWYNAVVRADFGPVLIQAGANIQDGSIVHGAGDVVIGPGTTIAHLCVVHGAHIGTEALIGNGAVVQDGVPIGDRAMVAAGTLVPPNTVIEAETLYRGAAANTAGPLSTGARFWVETNPQAYRDLANRHIAGVTQLGR
ncbi:MAG: gamma carbonic anhydrase family protein [Frankiaceae bacterium]|nr:gamma carbonic anhydrase family protein [Frankiaceae bacterium]MBV9872458.1 gamma carbonic anhydrase family protein [Frankiaceae bacterium]